MDLLVVCELRLMSMEELLLASGTISGSMRPVMATASTCLVQHSALAPPSAGPEAVGPNPINPPFHRSIATFHPCAKKVPHFKKNCLACVSP